MVNFPAGFDTDATLYVAVNNLRTTLTAGVSASDLVIPVVTTSGFPPRGFVTLTSNVSDYTNPEAVAYSGIDTLNFYATLRGADGTVAKAHNLNARADLNVVAAHHNQLKDAVVQLEHFVGVSGAENFLRQDDNGNVIVLKDIQINGALTSVSGSYSQSLTVSGLSVLHRGLRALRVNSGSEIIGPAINFTTTGGTGAAFSSSGNTAINLNVPASNALVGAGITTIASGTNTITIRSVPNAIVGGTGITVVSGASTTTINSSATGNALIGTGGITVTSGTSTITIRGTIPNALIGQGITQVISGTNTTTIRSVPNAIIAGPGITVASGTNATQISVNASASNNALVGADGIVITSGTSTITITGFASQLPVRQDFDFTSNTVDMGGGQSLINEVFNNRSLVQKLKVSPTASGVNSYLMQFYTKDTFSFDDRLEYEATGSGIYVDNDLWFHHDEDNTNMIHLRLTNNSLVNSTFNIQMRSEKFD